MSLPPPQADSSTASEADARIIETGRMRTMIAPSGKGPIISAHCVRRRDIVPHRARHSARRYQYAGRTGHQASIRS
jgi:hypothetical protein